MRPRALRIFIYAPLGRRLMDGPAICGKVGQISKKRVLQNAIRIGTMSENNMKDRSEKSKAVERRWRKAIGP